MEDLHCCQKAACDKGSEDRLGRNRGRPGSTARYRPVWLPSGPSHKDSIYFVAYISLLSRG